MIESVLNSSLNNQLQSIINTIQDNPGIGLMELSRKVDTHYCTTRYRVMELARLGHIRIEQKSNKTSLYPATRGD